MTNVRNILTVMQWLEQQNSALYAEKAFDLVAWDHLFETLSRFGAPEAFISLLQRLYTGSLSQILSNAYISPPFSILQGTHQGFPLYPLLFALAIEPLAVAVGASPTFHGIRIGTREVILSMFTDDMLLFVSDPTVSLQSITVTLDRCIMLRAFEIFRNIHIA